MKQEIIRGLQGMDITMLIDGGYLMWSYGVKPNYGGWHSARFKFKGGLLLIDSDSEWRRTIHPAYKSRRKEKIKASPEKQRKAAMVHDFKDVLGWDGTLSSLQVEGYEADDLISLLFLMGIGSDHVVAVDKDLHQVPGMKSAMHNHFGESSSRPMKLPKYAVRHYGHPKQPWEYVLIQALFGDKSDTIPRLLPSHPTRAKNLYNWIRGEQSPLQQYQTAIEHLGESFLRNVLLVIMPPPWMLEGWEDRYMLQQWPDWSKELFSGICDGSYWSRFGDNMDLEVTEHLFGSFIRGELEDHWTTLGPSLLVR